MTVFWTDHRLSQLKKVVDELATKDKEEEEQEKLIAEMHKRVRAFFWAVDSLCPFLIDLRI